MRDEWNSDLEEEGNPLTKPGGEDLEEGPEEDAEKGTDELEILDDGTLEEE